MKKGFTLIELMVVIAVVAILSSVIAVNGSAARAKARDAQRITDISNLQLALGLYANKNKKYPDTLDDLVTYKFINSVPKDPKEDTTTFMYKYCTSGTNYCLGANLEKPNGNISVQTCSPTVCSLSLPAKPTDGGQYIVTK